MRSSSGSSDARFVRLVLPLAVLAVTGVAFVLLLRGRPEGDRPSLDAALRVSGELTRGGHRAVSELTRVPDAKEQAIGAEMAEAIAASWRVITPDGASTDQERAIARFVDGVGRALLPHVERKGIRFRFAVLEESQVNAFATAGGNIYVTTGMLAFVESEAELAAVLGHELAHVDLRHCIEQIQAAVLAREIAGDDLAQWVHVGVDLIGRAYSEDQELESDEYGTVFAARAGYDPTRALDLFRRMGQRFEEPEAPMDPDPVREAERVFARGLERYLATHPPTAQRVQRIRRTLDRHGFGRSGGPYYVGERNLRELLPRADREFPDEWRR